MNQYIEKVRSNIEYAKDEQEQANKNGENQNDVNLKEMISELKDSIQKLEKEKKEQEENYKIGIKTQKKRLTQVEQYIKILKRYIEYKCIGGK